MVKHPKKTKVIMSLPRSLSGGVWSPAIREKVDVFCVRERVVGIRVRVNFFGERGAEVVSESK